MFEKSYRNKSILTHHFQVRPFNTFFYGILINILYYTNCMLLVIIFQKEIRSVFMASSY